MEIQTELPFDSLHMFVIKYMCSIARKKTLFLICLELSHVPLEVTGAL